MNRKRRGICLLVGLALLALALAMGIMLLVWNRFTLSVELEGKREMFQEFDEPYQEPGARAVLRGSRFWKDGIVLNRTHIIVTGQPQEDALGKHTLTYQADFFLWHGQAQRQVTLIDSVCPVISLVEAPEGEGTHAKFREPGFQAMDNRDGDITDRVKRIEQPGKIIYTVVDSSGNPASVERSIPLVLWDPPRIELTGGESFSIMAGSVYEEPGYTALDAQDTELTDAVQVEGEVIWWKPGVYPVVYTVSDAFENLTQVTRTVEVMAQERPATVWPQTKTIYLTFDDGPGPYTRQLLDILDAYGAKATFFVTDNGYAHVLGDIAARGHSIGAHTATHRYEEVYASPEAYFQDLRQIRRVIYDNTGIWSTLVRFPGGSSNQVSRHSCEGIMTTLSDAVRDAGYQYFDWNVDSDDAGGAHTAEAVFQNVIAGVQNQRVSIVLQHDIHGYSVDAVEKILRWGRDNGYRFAALQPNRPGFHHTIFN